MTKVKRKIIEIDEELCDGCEDCIISCPEQAIQIVETSSGPKARLVKELYCDGLGACIGSCPRGALTIEERDVEPYNEEATIARIKETAPEMLETHIKHLKEHEMELPEYHSHKMSGMHSCPSARILEWSKKEETVDDALRIPSQLHQWPIKIHLVPPHAPYLKNAEIILVADCVPFAYPNFHQDFLKDKSVLIGCPKLDDVNSYIEKLVEIIKTAHPKKMTVVHMEVPCCFGLVHALKKAIELAGENVPFDTVKIGIKGDNMQKAV
ncbi:4Fe-4S dicluster domain-containing protein [bacterium]|nr:4Fe-4S dicluster domain-containing protein [bacterium]